MSNYAKFHVTHQFYCFMVGNWHSFILLIMVFQVIVPKLVYIEYHNMWSKRVNDGCQQFLNKPYVCSKMSFVPWTGCLTCETDFNNMYTENCQNFLSTFLIKLNTWLEILSLNPVKKKLILLVRPNIICALSRGCRA